MLTADKVTELFCMADDFCKFFDKMTAKYTLKSENKRPYHRIQLITKLNYRKHVGSYCRILYVSEKAVYQCTKDIGYTANAILNSSNSRYITKKQGEQDCHLLIKSGAVTSAKRPIYKC